MSFVVVAHWRTDPVHVDTVRAVLARHAVASEAEEGCHQFTALQDAADPTRFALFEVYADKAAFQAHRRTPHFRQNVERTIAPLLVERVWATYAPVE
jgi:quinol monooxygenase YgiN